MNSFLFQVFVEVSVSVEISLLWPQICMLAETDDDFPLNDGQARNRNGVKSLICGFFLNERLKTGKAETVDTRHLFFQGETAVCGWWWGLATVVTLFLLRLSGPNRRQNGD